MPKVFELFCTLKAHALSDHEININVKDEAKAQKILDNKNETPQDKNKRYNATKKRKRKDKREDIKMVLNY